MQFFLNQIYCSPEKSKKMSTYKTHCCRKIFKNKDGHNWEDYIMAAAIFLILVSLSFFLH